MDKFPALIAALFFPVLPLFGETTSILEHGAKGDGEFLNTGAIQAAIDQCHDQGGGTVYVPAGRFRTGTIILKSHVGLYLEAGAVLLGSTKLEDYPEMYPAFRSYMDVNYVDKSLIYAEDAEHISIGGQGTIDGQGESAVFDLPGRENYKKRPYLINDCMIYDTRLAAVALEMVDGGTMDRIQIHHITADGARGGIFIRLGNRARHHLALGSGGSKKYDFEENKKLGKVGMGSMQNITISNFRCKGADTVGCCISGIPGYEIRNLTIRDVQLSFAGEGAGKE